MIDRRDFLKVGAVGGAGLLLGSASIAAPPIRTKEDLMAALAKCRGGEEIEVAALLTQVVLQNLRFPADRPVKLRGRFATVQRPDDKVQAALEINNCTGLHLIDSDLQGFIRGRYDRWGRGVMMTGASDITLSGCRIGDVIQGIGANLTNRLHVIDSDIVGVGPFGMQVCAIKGFIARRNAIRDFNINIPPNDLWNGEHADAIMIHMVPRWNQASAWAETGSSDILIEDNFVLGDPDNHPQGLFLRDSAKKGGRFERATLRNNDLWGTMWSGISVESADDKLIIENNRLRCLSDPGRPLPGGAVTQARIVVGGLPPAVLAGNQASFFALNGKQVDSRGVREAFCVRHVDAEKAFAAWRGARTAGKLPSQQPA